MEAKQAISFWAMAHHVVMSDDAKAAAVAVLEEAFGAGVRAAIERAKDEYRKDHAGGCKMFSQGNACTCFLCRMDDLQKP